jgi:Domain of unknown function (DUF397)
MSAPDLARATWRKSSYSNASGSCVEIAVLTGAVGEHGIAIRDSKDPHGPALTFTTRQWHDFAVAIKTSELYLF